MASHITKVAPAGTATVIAAANASADAAYRTWARTVWRWAARLGGPDADADDIVQEVFLVAHRRWHEFRGDAKITTWLYEITVRVVQARRRKERLRRFFLGSVVAGAIADDHRPPPTPLEALEGQRAAALTYQLLDRLPEHFRTVLILYELEELPCPEIAAITRTTTGNVWTRLHRARARFLALFEAAQKKESDGKPP